MYHVEVIPKVWEPPHRREEQENDLLFEELERRFLAPYRKAKPIVIRGRTITTDDIHRIRIYETQQELGTPASIPFGPMAEVTKKFITGPPGWELEEGSADAKDLVRLQTLVKFSWFMVGTTRHATRSLDF